VQVDSRADMRRAVERVKELGAAGESTGGAVRVRALGLQPGLGSPVFGKLSARMGQALLSIGGVKAIDVGNGRNAAKLTGSRNNDPFVATGDGVEPVSNRSGGLLGGISTGLPLEFVVWVKPTPSVSVTQSSVDIATGEPVALSVDGRFDKNITPRVAVVAEAMACLVLADAMLCAGCIHPTRLKGPERNGS